MLTSQAAQTSHLSGEKDPNEPPAASQPTCHQPSTVWEQEQALEGLPGRGERACPEKGCPSRVFWPVVPSPQAQAWGTSWSSLLLVAGPLALGRPPPPVSLEVPLPQLLLPALPAQLPLLWAPWPFHSPVSPAKCRAAEVSEGGSCLRDVTGVP